MRSGAIIARCDEVAANEYVFRVKRAAPGRFCLSLTAPPGCHKVPAGNRGGEVFGALRATARQERGGRYGVISRMYAMG